MIRNVYKELGHILRTIFLINVGSAFCFMIEERKVQDKSERIDSFNPIVFLQPSIDV